MNRILKYLDTPLAGILCIAFAILNRCTLAWFVSFIGKDKRLQLTMAENFLSGNGLGATKYFLADIYTPVFDKAQEFPPGYSLLISPFLQLFQGNEYLAVTVLDLIIAVSFILAVRYICKSAGLSDAIANLITLVTGCFQYVFFMLSTPTDAISLCLLFVGIARVLYILKPGYKINTIQIILTGFLFFLPFLFRYMNLISGLLLPLIISFYGLMRKEARLFRTGLLLFMVTGLFSLTMMFCLKAWSGNMFPASYFPKGFYPANLLHWYPFIPASFINLDFAAQRVEQFSGITYTSAVKIFEALNLLLIAILITGVLISLLKRKIKIPETPFGRFIITGALLSLSIFLTLAFSSLRYASKQGPFSWTFVAEQRYFGFVYIFLQIVFIALFCSAAVKAMPRLIRIAAPAFFLLLCVEIFHGVYYNAKTVFARSRMEAGQMHKGDYLFFKTLCDSLSAQYPGREILVASIDRHYCHTAIQRGHKGIFDAEKLNSIPIHVREKALLLIPVHYADWWLVEDYIDRKKPRLIGTASGTQFYLEELNPRCP